MKFAAQTTHSAKFLKIG